MSQSVFYELKLQLLFFFLVKIYILLCLIIHIILWYEVFFFFFSDFHCTSQEDSYVIFKYIFIFTSELWFWRGLLRVPWTARRSNQSILKEISSEYSLEGLMLKLKCQYFGHLMRRNDSFEKTLMFGKIKGRRRRGWPRDEIVGWLGWLNGHESE